MVELKYLYKLTIFNLQIIGKKYEKTDFGNYTGVLVLALSVTTYIFFSKSKLVSSKEQEVINLNLEMIN